MKQHKQLIGFLLEIAFFISGGFFINYNKLIACFLLILGLIMAVVVGEQIKKDAISREIN